MADALALHSPDQHAEAMPAVGLQFFVLDALRQRLGVVQVGGNQRGAVKQAGAANAGGDRFRHRQAAMAGALENIPFSPRPGHVLTEPEVLVA
jgi:hypothetical protein